MERAAYEPVPLDFPRLPAEAQLGRVREFAAWMRRRRSVRHFSPEAVPIELIEAAIAVAASAPSGANRQPWRFVVESVGIACGLLLAALHMAGLATLTHTPSPMGFLSRILGRPKNEKPYLLIPVGFPAADAVVPRIEKKPLHQVAIRL